MKYNVEIISYFSVWISAVFYSVYCFSKKTEQFFRSYNDVFGDFNNGWSFLTRKKDAGDFEWETINYFIRIVFPWAVAYLVTSEVLRRFKLSVEVQQCFIITFSLFFITSTFGIFFLFPILFQPFLFTLFSYLNNKTFIWICNFICLILVSFLKKLNTNEEFLPYAGIDSFQAYVIVLCTCWTNLRCTSYYLNYSENNFLTSFSYFLYFPLLCSGPFVSYQDFKKIFNTAECASFTVRIIKLIKNVFRCAFWMFFVNFWLHFVYVNAAGFQEELVRKFDLWSLCGYGYAMGQFFHIKYVVLYGLSTSLASFDNVEVPTLPRCIGRVHLYSDMWRYFDPGLYKFLLHCIFLPVKQMSIMKNKLLPSLLCFGFVYIWHGVENYILIWSALNYIGICFEYSCRIIYKKSRLKGMFGAEWMRRITCILAAPLLCMSAISNFYFFAGVQIGNIFFERVLYGDFLGFIVLIFVLYCCCQISTQLKAVEAHKM